MASIVAVTVQLGTGLYQQHCWGYNTTPAYIAPKSDSTALLDLCRLMIKVQAERIVHVRICKLLSSGAQVSVACGNRSLVPWVQDSLVTHRSERLKPNSSTVVARQPV